MSRNIDDLVPELAKLCRKHIAACKAKNIDLLVYNTLRTKKEQCLNYAAGRLLYTLPNEVLETIPDEIEAWKKQGLIKGPGNVITWTLRSRHLEGRAFDVVPVVNGITIWDNDDLWNQIVYEGELLGLESGSRFKIPDKPHFQLPEQKL